MNHAACAPRIGARIGLFTRATGILSLACTLTVHAQMITPGQFEVSNGAATYTIPIQLPPGSVVLQPALALSYSSQAGNGLLGVGWSLSGLSSITRCPRTVAQDGVRGIVNYDLNDRYCLNGQRLLAINGSDGAHGTEYRTERESFSKVTSSTETGVTNGPASFIVKTAAGLTMEYGNTVDSRIELNGKTVVTEWALNKAYDTKGNYYSITYLEGADGALGSYVPSSIDWGGNMNVGTPNNRAVKFTYEVRQDKMQGYDFGSDRRSTVRLTKIASFSNLNPFNEYRLTYKMATESKTARSLITDISECGAGGSCRSALKNSYSNTPLAFTSPTWPISYLQPTDGYYWSGDFNGDGLADIASCQHAGSVYVKLSTGTEFTNNVWSVDPNWGGAQWTWAADFNGDGKTDIASVSGGNAYMKLSTPAGNAFTSETWPVDPNWGGPEWTWIGDFNGDGKSDIATGIGGNVYMKISTGTKFVSEIWPVERLWSSTSPYTWTGDFNGDGKTDIASAEGGNVYMKLSTGTSFSSETWTVDRLKWGGAGFYWVADFNGDGLSDIASLSERNLYMKLSTGKKFVEETWDVQPLSIAATYTRVGDFNGDGLADLATASYGNLYLKLSTGSSMQSVTLPVKDAWAAASSTWIGDFDGDGRSDWASWAYGNVWMKIATGAQDRVSAFTNGVGVAVTPSYGTLARLIGSSYQKTVVPSLPLITVAGSTPVVTSVASPNGVGGTSTTQYTYGNLLAEVGLAGRGELGFEWIQSKNMNTGSVRRTYYRQDWPYLGLVSMEGTGTSEANWKNLTYTVNTSFTCMATVGAAASAPCTTTGTSPTVKPGARYFIYPNQIDTQAWEYTGKTASDGIYIALPRTRTTQTLDDYGNATMVKLETFNPDGSASGYSKTTDSVFAPVDPAKWHLGRLIRSSVTATAP